MSITVEVASTKGFSTGDALFFDENEEEGYEVVKIIDDTHISLHPFEYEIIVH